MKEFFRSILKYLPYDGRILIRTYRMTTAKWRSITIRLKIYFGAYNIPKPETVYWINPLRVKFHTNYGKGKNFKDNVFDAKKDGGKIIGGDWDLAEYKFNDLAVYKSIKARITSDAKWEDTPYFKEILDSVTAGHFVRGCKNYNDILKYFNYIDTLIHEIKHNNYKSHDQVNDCQNHSSNLLCEEVTVNVSRNGEFLFQDGRHRLAIAKVLKINLIPVNIFVRHKDWQLFREQVWNMACSAGGGAAINKGVLYQPPVHPDLSDIPAAHNCVDRFEAIKNNLSSGSGSLLDVGANLGYFSHKFEDLGFNCYAVEINEGIANVADKIRIAENKTFKIVQENILLDLNSDINARKYDVVIALNIFHHFLKDEKMYDLFKKWLKNLKLKEMFFEPHLFNEEQMQNSYKNMDDIGFINFIIEHSTLQDSVKIFTSDDGRPLYKLT